MNVTLMLATERNQIMNSWCGTALSNRTSVNIEKTEAFSIYTSVVVPLRISYKNCDPCEKPIAL